MMILGQTHHILDSSTNFIVKIKFYWLYFNNIIRN